MITAKPAHIATQEAGAIAAIGHHILPADAVNSKLTAAGIERWVKETDIPPHTVLLRLVYISNSSELGTIYSKGGLTDIAAVCKRHGLLLFMDGARLGTALCSQRFDVTLKDVFD